MKKNQLREWLYLLVPFDNNRGHNPAQTDPWFHMNGAVPKWCPIFILYASHTKTLPANWLLSCIAAPWVLFLVGWDNGPLPYLTIICSISIFFHLPHIFGFPSHLGNPSIPWVFGLRSYRVLSRNHLQTNWRPRSNRTWRCSKLWMKGIKSYQKLLVDE